MMDGLEASSILSGTEGEFNDWYKGWVQRLATLE